MKTFSVGKTFSNTHSEENNNVAVDFVTFLASNTVDTVHVSLSTVLCAVLYSTSFLALLLYLIPLLLYTLPLLLCPMPLLQYRLPLLLCLLPLLL